MRRRELITLLGGAAAAWPLAARAQQSKVWRIGQVLPLEAMGHLAKAFEQRLANLGHVQGKNITLVNLVVPPQPKAIEDGIRSLLPNIDLLVVWSTIGAVAAKKVVFSVPVVFLSVGVPVDIGLVESLAHPGGNMTGITFEAATETYAKRLQILKEIVPNLERVTVLRAVGDPNVVHAMASLEQSAPGLGAKLIPIDIGSADDLPAAFVEMQRSRAQGLISIAGAFTYLNSNQIADLTVRHHLPSCHGFKETVAAGALISLGPDMVAMTDQGAAYVDKILHGAKPADLPVQQPTKLELVINLKTAKALGLAVPPNLLAIADEVIE
jgi:putative tryptophan/tyrosine transport system substrate-binding protein